MTSRLPKQLLILLATIAITRGFMVISFPIGAAVNVDDNQAAQRYLIDAILNEKIFVGNLRYNTGYAFFTAPLYWLSEQVPAVSNQLLLLFQVAIASTIPLFIYDIYRLENRRNLGFFVGMLGALDPFAWQWAHLYLPVYLVAALFVIGVWAIQRSRFATSERLQLLWVCLAALALGYATVTRINMALTVAALGVMLFFIPQFDMRRRLQYFVLLGGISAGILVAYVLAIHYPSTGTLTISCVRGTNLLNNIVDNPYMRLTEETGEHTATYLAYQVYDVPDGASVFADVYPRWRDTDAWFPPEMTEAYRVQSPENVPETVYIVPRIELNYIFPPCEMDDLYGQVAQEGIRENFGGYIYGGLVTTAKMLSHIPPNGEALPYNHLPKSDDYPLTLQNFTSLLRMDDGRYYTGELLWQTGHKLYHFLITLTRPLKWLTIPAIIFAFVRPRWLTISSSVILLTTIVTLAYLSRNEPRYYATIAAFNMVVIGEFLWMVILWVKQRLTTDD